MVPAKGGPNSSYCYRTQRVSSARGDSSNTKERDGSKAENSSSRPGRRQRRRGYGWCCRSAPVSLQARTSPHAWEQLTFALRGWLAPDTIYVICGCTENRGISHQRERCLSPFDSVAPVSDRRSIFEELFVSSTVLSVSYFWRG